MCSVFSSIAQYVQTLSNITQYSCIVSNAFLANRFVLHIGQSITGFVVAEAAGWTRFSSGKIPVRIGRNCLVPERRASRRCWRSSRGVVLAAAARAVSLGTSGGGSEGGRGPAVVGTGSVLRKQPEKRFGQHQEQDPKTEAVSRD